MRVKTAECAARAVGAFTIVIGDQLSARIAGTIINEIKHHANRQIVIRPPCSFFASLSYWKWRPVVKAKGEEQISQAKGPPLSRDS